MTAVAGINGFGRFGLHLLRYWLDRNRESGFRIGFINDEVLDLEQSYQIITSDPYVTFLDYRIERTTEGLVIQDRHGGTHEILYTHRPQQEIPWLGQPDIFMECSGRYAKAATSRLYLTGKTRIVMISATSWDADQTLVYGFNEETYDPEKHKIISYGSCTVNAYVPFADYIHRKYGILDSDVNVVHNVPPYRLPHHQTLQRKFCTLERSGPELLPFIDPDRNFVVNYTVVPWTGPSMFDFRFRLEQPVDRDRLIAQLMKDMDQGELAGLYSMDEADVGPLAYVGTPYSAVFIKQGIKQRQDQIYLPSYFDTENSVNRYLDLANHIQSKL